MRCPPARPTWREQFASPPCFTLQHSSGRTIINIGVTFAKHPMSAISSITATQTNSSSETLQAALQQAKRTASQAESTAQTLETQASNAQAAASDAQNYASSLSTQAGEAQLNVGWTQQNLAAVETAGQLNSEIASVVKNVVQAQPTKQASTATPPPVVNTRGQVTGKIINTSA